MISEEHDVFRNLKLFKIPYAHSAFCFITLDWEVESSGRQSHLCPHLIIDPTYSYLKNSSFSLA